MSAKRPRYMSPDDFLKYHQANFKSIDTAIKKIDSMLDKAKEDDIIQPLTRLYGFLLGAWAESRLNKLLYEKGGFNDIHRKTIRSGATHLERWQISVEIAFCVNYKPENDDLEELLFTPKAQFNAILNMLEEDLRPIIEIRNKLAHGQWVYPFNDECTDVEDKKYNDLRNENLLTLKWKKKLISRIAVIINNLVISKKDFESDFDNNYKGFEDIKKKLKKYKEPNYYINSIIRILKKVLKNKTAPSR